jgi:hypothetical protein
MSTRAERSFFWEVQHLPEDVQGELVESLQIVDRAKHLGLDSLSIEMAHDKLQAQLADYPTAAEALRSPSARVVSLP